MDVVISASHGPAANLGRMALSTARGGVRSPGRIGVSVAVSSYGASRAGSAPLSVCGVITSINFSLSCPRAMGESGGESPLSESVLSLSRQSRLHVSWSQDG